MKMAQKSSVLPHQYQYELVDHLCEHNGIAFLPVTNDKTYVAIMIIKRLSKLLQYTPSEGGKRTIFMCNTVTLAHQQYVEIRKRINFKIGLYTEEVEQENWNRKQWISEFEENQILIGTAQVFLNCIVQNIIKITELNLVIIDECHYATKHHPMHSFLNLVHDIDMAERPRVIGFTDILIKGNNLSNVNEELQNLETIFNGNIITLRTLEPFNNIMLYTVKPMEHIVSYNSDNHIFSIERNIESIVLNWKTVIDHFYIGTLEKKLTKDLAHLAELKEKELIKNLIDDFMYQVKEFGLYTASIAIMLLLIEFEIEKRQAKSIDLRNLYQYCITRCEHIKHVLMKQFKTTLGENSNSTINDSMCNTKNIILNYSSAKMKCFLSTLTKYFENRKPQDITCLVFVQSDYTAKCIFYVLLNYIKDCSELEGVITPQLFVDRKNSVHSIECILNHKWNENIKHQFRLKMCNLIVCSNILKDFNDIPPAFNYVFFLDELFTFNSYIQVKVRTQSEMSSYIIFCDSLKMSSTKDRIELYKTTHEYIKEFLLSRILMSDESNISNSPTLNTIMPPFQISNGAQLMAASVLPLLERYCQSLPGDIYSNCMPWFSKITCASGCQVALKLPLQSRLKETIISDVMGNAKEGKISAAFKACIKLYELGDLNPNLLPWTKSECIEQVSNDLFQNWKKHANNVSKQFMDENCMRLYDNMCPAEFYNALPSIDDKCYAYSIDFFVDFSINDYNAHLVKYLNTKSTYAILLRNRLPQLAEMPLFMSQGKLHVQISDKPVECVLYSKEQLEKLKRFHIMIFKDLLNLWNTFFVVDQRNKENSYLIVPMNSLGCIDWNLVENFQYLMPSKCFNLNEKEPQEYLDMIVRKAYNNQDDIYVVTKIRHDLNPLSPFCNTNYKNYKEFFERRHHAKIINDKQFLLEVKELTNQRNFLNDSLDVCAELKKSQDTIILIPELCITFNYPSNMWLKALFLPTILHRVYYMLHAETLRQKINNSLGLDKYFSQYKPKALTFDTSLKHIGDTNKNVIYKEEDEIYETSLDSVNNTEVTVVENNDVIKIPWKEYMEPIDCIYRLNDIVSLELDYYHSFVHGLISDIKNLKNLIHDNDGLCSKSQLNLPNVRYAKITQESTLLYKTHQYLPLSKTNVSNKSKYHLNIWERSLQKESDLQSAEQDDFLAAITTASACEMFDMGRFKFLGNSFLKFSVSFYLANKYPKWNHGYLCTIKDRMLSNCNLLYCMLEMDIPKRIYNNVFVPSINYLPPLVALPQNLLELLANSKCPLMANIPSRMFFSIVFTEEEIYSGFCDPNILLQFKESCENIEAQMEANIPIFIESDMNLYVYKQTLCDEIITDTLKALLGVCVKNYGIQRSFKMLEFFGLVKTDRTLPLANLLDLQFYTEQLQGCIDSKELDAFLVNGDILERNLGYTFHNRSYLLQAITHPSNSTNRLTGCYQPLQFIGDAILDMLITCYIFERQPRTALDMINNMRTALINNIMLACICVRQRFHLFMLYESALLSDAITKFAEFLETQNYQFTEQVRLLIEEESYDDLYDDIEEYSEWYKIKRNVDVPKALAHLVQALIAAIYLDSKDLFVTWHVIYNLFESEIMEFSKAVPIMDPICQLMENQLTKATFSLPIKRNNLFIVTCTFHYLGKTIKVNGYGRNSKYAKTVAAKRALHILRQHSK